MRMELSWMGEKLASTRKQADPGALLEFVKKNQSPNTIIVDATADEAIVEMV